MSIKPGIMSSEFWISSILSLLSLAGAAGLIGPNDLPAVSENVKTIVLGFFALATVINYVVGRVKLKLGQP